MTPFDAYLQTLYAVPMKIALYRLHPSADVEGVWDRLESLGYSLLYSESDGEVCRIFGQALSQKEKDALLKQIPEVEAIEEALLPEIDWEAQWQQHGQGYKDGYLEIDTADYCQNRTPSLIRLVPGPGFGDLSHPTTRLVMKLMANLVKGKRVVDIGCGSGVLSLAAIAMGAVDAYGIDIDPQAVEHARKNVALNGMEKYVHFGLPEDVEALIPKAPLIALMNMIRSEQVVAWESFSPWHQMVDKMVVSGILKEEKEAYLAQCRAWGFKLIEEREEEGWLGFILETR